MYKDNINSNKKLLESLKKFHTSKSRRDLEKDKEKYYTNQKCVDMCIENIKKLGFINENDIIIEPSAGNGSFIDHILKLVNESYYFDIDPENELITQQDFLQLDLNSTFSQNTNFHFIGNPPFGRQSSLAIKFIKHICKFDKTKSICFILPKSFKKISMQKYIPLNYHLLFEKNVSDDKYFNLNGNDINIPCVFQIWYNKIDELRYVPEILEEKGYTFIKKEEICFDKTISLRRVGISAGEIYFENLSSKSFQSHHFIRFNNKNNYTRIINNIDNIKNDFIHDNTTGPRSLSKQDIIFVLNKYTI